MPVGTLYQCNDAFFEVKYRIIARAGGRMIKGFLQVDGEITSCLRTMIASWEPVAESR
jgi:hypothetical protein